MEGASLEGQLKAAQIAELYARASKENAEGAKIEEEKLWFQLNSQIDLLQKLGAGHRIVQLPDRTLAIVIGDKVLRTLPGTASEPGEQRREGND